MRELTNIYEKAKVYVVLGASLSLLVVAEHGKGRETTITDSVRQTMKETPTATVPAPLTDPIPEKIAFGNITIRLEPFLRLPEAKDIDTVILSSAYARIQYLMPVPGNSARLAINDLRGQLYLIDAKRKTYSLYLDHRRQDVGFYTSPRPNEMGFMGVAFHPHFENPGKPGYGKFYTAYSASSDSGVADYHDDNAESHETVIREWTTTDPRANEFTGASREILRVGQHRITRNVGSIAFNPTARENSPEFGLLYISIGDGGSGAEDPCGDGGRNYGIPPDNPFVGRDDAAPEIWIYGLHHPQHFSWDTADGRLFFTEIGHAMVEEVNLGIVGGNYGWGLREGTFATSAAYDDTLVGREYPRPKHDAIPLVYPIAQYDHDEGYVIGSLNMLLGSIGKVVDWKMAVP